MGRASQTGSTSPATSYSAATPLIVPHYNLVLAADCLRDVGRARVAGDLWRQVKNRLEAALELPLQKSCVIGRVLQTIRIQPTIHQVIQGRTLAAEALFRMENNTSGTKPAFWRLPWGEPVWVEVPAGRFYMGEGDLGFRVAVSPISSGL
jgi:hypothetical protein